MTGPPPALVRALVAGPSIVAAVEWHEAVGSTQEAAAAAARAGAPEGHLVLADVQHAGRGRRGRDWHAPAGTSLLASLVLRPAVAPAALPLLSLVAAVALVDVAGRYCPGAALKWPNDLLLGGRKAAGILAETAAGGAVVLGVGVDVDWRGVARPTGAPTMTSMVEAAGTTVDRWRVLAAFVGVFGRCYLDWQDDPTGVLPAYRARCATVGEQVRVTVPGGAPVVGLAEGIGADGALEVRDATGRLHRLSAGDVEHVRPARSGPTV